ncbi:serine hydrolase domain-containing protein [Thiothrix nivea]|uniref:Beta-lactamase n=1 Tax=Thiothrix nivea (strain ATCC 35100 / DSM 5205 / JP2) TaxID=870187 RepID=A0A656HIU7_THINJ|nr:serine hydrolase domain-containing protein [Thiothrix nivea]EIJ36848.1 beta-lactamase [Thiothrix nivea DSM 5205]
MTLTQPVKPGFIRAIFLALILTLLTACGGGGNNQTTTVATASSFSASQADTSINQILARTVAQENIVNSVILFAAPDQHYQYLQAGGTANPTSNEAMTPAHPFRIASLSKPFTATVVLQLVEEGYFSLDTPLSGILADADMPAGYTLDDLHVLQGKKSGGSITIRQLLQHTSGIRDFMMDAPTGNPATASGGIVASTVLDSLNSNPQGLAARQWDKQQLLAYYLDSGYGQNALFAPGSQHYYSDSGYLLLGIVIEKATGLSLTANLRARIFDRLGLAHTYHENFEAARGGVLAHHFFDLKAFGNQQNIDVAAANINTSASWAGGAIVSSAEDLLVFLQALMHNELFRNASTLADMQRLTSASPNYGLGLMGGTINGYQVWAHTGFWGTLMAYSPQKNAWLVIAVNQVMADVEAVGMAVFQAALDAKL